MISSLDEIKEKYPFFYSTCYDVCLADLLNTMIIMAGSTFIQNNCNFVGEGCPTQTELLRLKK